MKGNPLQGSVTNAWWDGPYFHPRTWEAKDISQTLINQLRKSNHGFEATEGITCDYEDALQSLKAVFPSLEVPKPQSRHSRALLVSLSSAAFCMFVLQVCSAGLCQGFKGCKASGSWRDRRVVFAFSTAGKLDQFTEDYTLCQ